MLPREDRPTRVFAKEFAKIEVCAALQVGFFDDAKMEEVTLKPQWEFVPDEVFEVLKANAAGAVGSHLAAD
jgi:hypothetical protein